MLAALATGSFAASPQPSDAGKRLEDVERALEKQRGHGEHLKQQARGLERELERLQQDLVVAARAVQEYEGEATALETQLRELTATERKRLAVLGQNRMQVGQVLAALGRIARYPPEALIAQPTSPADTVRGAILLRAAVPEIERRAHELKEQLAALSEARGQIVARRRQLAALSESLDKETRRLNGLLARKSEVKRSAESESEITADRIRVLAEEADSLRDLLAKLEEERRRHDEAKAQAGAKAQKSVTRPTSPQPSPPLGSAGESPARSPLGAEREGPAEREGEVAFNRAVASRPITEARGKLRLPAIGRISGQYGQPLESGLSRKGIDIETRAQAQVVAPYEGRIVYAEKFRGYGQLLIIEHGEGYHTLLAGLDRLDGSVGQRVVAGEPVGVMGRPESGHSILYVELRRHGQPINPLPWLAAHEAKVSG